MMELKWRAEAGRRELGALLKALRLASGRSQQAVAAALGASQGYLSKVESGDSDLSLTQCIRLCQELGHEELRIRLKGSGSSVKPGRKLKKPRA